MKLTITSSYNQRVVDVEAIRHQQVEMTLYRLLDLLFGIPTAMQHGPALALFTMPGGEHGSLMVEARKKQLEVRELPPEMTTTVERLLKWLDDMRFFTSPPRPESVVFRSGEPPFPADDALMITIAPPRFMPRSESLVIDLLTDAATELMQGEKPYASAWRSFRRFYVSMRAQSDLRRDWNWRRFPAVKQPLTQLEDFETQIENALQPTLSQFAPFVETLEGRNFESFEMNRRIAALVQGVADRLNLLFACPKCGAAARFRCVVSPKVKTGIFMFSHGQQTHGGTSKIPPLKIFVEQPKSA